MSEIKKENGDGKNGGNCCCQNENERSQNGMQTGNNGKRSNQQNELKENGRNEYGRQNGNENCDCSKQSGSGWNETRYVPNGGENTARNKRIFSQGLIMTETKDCEREDARSERLENLMKNCEQATSEQPEIGREELQEVYRNASIGRESADILRPISEDRGFRNLLLKQYKAYSAVAKEIELYAANYGIELSPPSVFAKGMMFFTATVNTVKNKSNSKLAEIMIQGINMGIISVTKVINKLSDEGKTSPFADKMLELMQNNLNDMKLFL